MANHNKQHSLSRRATSQGPQAYPSSQITSSHSRATSQSPQAYSSSQILAPHRRATSHGPQVYPLSQISAPSERVQLLLKFLVSCSRGEVVELWKEFKLTSKEYLSLWSLLEKQSSLYKYVVDKLRFDWSPHTSRFVIRTPTPTHDFFTDCVAKEILSQLQKYASEDPEAAVVINQIASRATSWIILWDEEPVKGQYSKKNPDVSFKHTDCQYPCVVIETSYSQNRKDVVRLADDYMYGSDGNIKIVLGLDIDYNDATKRASISKWQPQKIPDPDREGKLIRKMIEIQSDLFRADDGTTAQGHGLSLELRDFAPRNIFDQMPEDTQNKIVVQITCEKLSSFLLKAEQDNHQTSTNTGKRAEPDPDCPKRRRENTPPESLSPGREHKFKKLEREDRERTEKEDKTWESE